MRSAKIWLGLAAVVLASGCAQMPKQAFNREAATHVHKLVVARQANQDAYEANVLGHPGMSFGLIGGLVAAADMAAKSSQLTKAIDPAETRLQDRFTDRLVESLQRAGYATVVLVVPSGTKEVDLLSFVAKQNTQADAVVAVNLYGGYWAAGPSTDYQPRLAAAVKVSDLRTSSVLYQDTITYGYPLAGSKTIHFASDAKYRFASIGSLTSDAALTRAGLLDGIGVVAEQIATDLKRN
jgi:hypothetical protein